MILIDLNQVVFSALTLQKEEINESLVRHIVLNSLRLIRNKFFDKYGEMVIASDNKHYWRREAFPYYKANRKKDRDASIYNWPVIFECMNKIKQELQEIFPYKFVDVRGAEADDIISVIIEKMPVNMNALIVSGDKDFIQLHGIKPYVQQYDPVRKKWIKHPNPAEYLREHIVRGDRSDGVPNIRTPDASLATGERQKTISSKMLNSWLEGGIPPELQRNYERNKLLIDMKEIPVDLKENIMEAYNQMPKGHRGKLYNYFIEKRLKNLMENISEF